MTALVGGVSQLYQGDLDLGRRAVQRLRGEDLGENVLVEDFHYGAVAVAQRLQDIDPDALVLVGARDGDRPPGTVERRRVDEPDLDAAEVQVAVGDAGTGYVALDLVVEVAWGLGVLPGRTVAIEVEPARTEPSEEMSQQALAGLDEALGIIRAEVRRVPLLEVADDIRATIADGHLAPSGSLEALERLLEQLQVLDHEGRWGSTYAERDRLKLRISAGDVSEGMTHVDWGLWWGLIEELDRLQPLEATRP